MDTFVILTYIIIASIILETNAQDAPTLAQCRVTSSPVVSANHGVSVFQRRVVTSSLGCDSRQVTSKEEEIRVISVNDANMDADAVITVDLQPLHQTPDDVSPLILVLTSLKPVTWRLTSRILNNVTRHTIMLSENSRLLRDTSLRMRVRRLDRFPVEPELLFDFVKYIYKAVTSFNQIIDHVTSAILTVGTDANLPAECSLQNSFNSPTLTLLSDVAQPITGCQVPAETPTSRREVHIVEITSATSTSVTLDVTSRDSTLNKSLILVLKSPKQVKWNISFSGVAGDVLIVSNNTVVTSVADDIRVDRKAQDLSAMTGQELVDSVGLQYGAVRTYSQSLSGNLISLRLVKTAAYITAEETRGFSPFFYPVMSRDALAAAMTVQCRTGGFKVILDKQLLKNQGIGRDHLSLNDPKCRPSQNRTHFILDTNVGACSTAQQHHQYTVTFINKVIVHKLPSDDKALQEYGHLVHPVSLVTPAPGVVKDWTPDSISVDVTCNYTIQGLVDAHVSFPKSTRHQADDDDVIPVVYRLELYASRRYSTVLYDYPQYVTAGSRLYVQADISGDLNLRVTVHSCWLMRTAVYQQEEARHMLIEKGCIADTGVKWLSDDVTDHLANDFNQRQRFSLLVNRTLNQAQYLFLHCQLITCSKDGLYGAPSIQGCKTPEDYCRHQRLFGPGIQPEYHHLLKGPINIKASDPISSQSASSMHDQQEAYLRPPNYRDETDDMSSGRGNRQPTIIVQGLESGTVVGIAFAAFIIGLLLTASLWFIYKHTEEAVGHSKNRRQAPLDIAVTSCEETAPTSGQPTAV